MLAMELGGHGFAWQAPPVENGKCLPVKPGVAAVAVIVEDIIEVTDD